jgi:alkylation response protein AidB-like acyl-CoA dehydrogenase
LVSVPFGQGSAPGGQVLIGFTSEQSQLREATRDLLAEVSSEDRVRALMPDPAGTDPDAWRQLAGLGLPGIALPGRFGGDGGSLVDQGVVLEEMGRVVCGGPYFSTAVLAAQTLLAAPDGDPVAAELLHGICATGLTATLAVTEAGGRWDEAGVTLQAAPGASGWELTGSKTFVPDGATADVILVPARTAAGLSLFAVPGTAAGLTRVPLPAMDQTRKQARLDFTAAGGRLIGADGAGWVAVERGLRRAAVGLAAEQAGGAERVLELMVDHARTRHQFGRPIGSFQAVQHTCAAVLVDVEAAKSAAYYALRTAAAGSGEASQSGEDELAAVASLAKAVCSETYRHAADAAIQVFGGIALTWEHPAQLYFKRARSSEILLGAPAYHREILARHLAL